MRRLAFFSLVWPLAQATAWDVAVWHQIVEYDANGANGANPAGGPNQVVRASRRPWSVPSEAHATCPSGRINTAVGAETTPSTGSSHGPA